MTSAICVVTRARGAAGSAERGALIERLAAAASAGADMIQVRERLFDDRALLAFVQELIRAVEPTTCRVLVNERTDIALAAGAAGVHLRSDSPAPSDVRAIVPAGFIIGRSVHALEEATFTAAAGGCDYRLFGTVFPSASKPDGHPIAGVAALADVCRAVTLPVLAIGGITAARAAEAAAAGAAGVAAISWFSEARDIAEAVSTLRDALTLNRGNV